MNSALELRDRSEPADERDLAPADVFDPVIELYKRDVDRTLLHANLRLNPEERSRKFQAFMHDIYQMRGQGRPHQKIWR